MAEAVRPAKKKRKAKKHQDDHICVKEDTTALEVPGIDFCSKKESGPDEKVAKDDDSVEREYGNLKALECTRSGLSEEHPDNQGGANIDVALTEEGSIALGDAHLETAQQSHNVLRERLASSEVETMDASNNEKQSGTDEEVVVIDDSIKTRPFELRLNDDKKDFCNEGELETTGLQENTEDTRDLSSISEASIAETSTDLNQDVSGTSAMSGNVLNVEEEQKHDETGIQGDDRNSEGLSEASARMFDDIIVNVYESPYAEATSHTGHTEGQSGTVAMLPSTCDSVELTDKTACTEQRSTAEVALQPAIFAPVAQNDAMIVSFPGQRPSSAGTSNVSGEKNLYGRIHDLFGKHQVSAKARETVIAFTEDDLKSFYYNPALGSIEEYVEDFIKETLEPRRDNEFYELLKTYQNTSKNLRNVESDVEILRKKCQEQKKTVWSTEMKTVTVQGICGDQQKVSHTHTYEVALFSVEQAAKISRTLDTIKNTIHETFTLAKYSCQLARIHISSYLHELHAKSPVFCGITKDSPVTGNDPLQVSHVVFGEIQHLRDCISALFIFIRRPTEDEEFYKDVDSWLHNLVALLLRVATLPDHIFLLNHVLRCPPGVTRKLAHFIQPLLFSRCPANFTSYDYLWHDPLLHHFVTMLATLLLPIKFRDKYLIKMKALLTPDGSDSAKNISWVIVDEDGEEDENPDESWMLIPENDLVALFLQFPFDKLYKLITGTEKHIGADVADSEAQGLNRNTATNVMQVFAFSTCLIEMLGKAFSLYSMRRYREFVKRLGRAIRTIVMHVSRYWAVYKNEYVGKYGANDTTFQLAFGSEYSLEKLQLEYDQFFIRASQQIFSAHKLGAWQFLIEMPFRSISSKMTWICYRFLHKGVGDTSVSLTDYIFSQSDQFDENDTTNFLEKLKSMTEAEVVFLLTAFANMAKARASNDNDFIAAVVQEIYEVSYLNPGTLDFLPKTGKDLLGSICVSHPFVMSLLLERVAETLESVREECVSLFQALPIEIWRPKLQDIQTIRNWLLRSPVDSSEHQLSRYLLTNLNWQYQDLDSDVLYLPRCVHRAVAILLVETCALRLSNRPGGIAVDVFKESPGILEQVTQLATSPYQRIIQHYSDQDLYKWLWEVIMFLHLHESECPANVMSFTSNCPSTSQDEGITSSYDRSDIFKTLSQPEALDLDTDEVLVNVLTSANNDGPLACYAALQMSSYGHDPKHLGLNGLTYLSVVLDEGHVYPTCRIIDNAIPTFLSKDLLGFSENSRFTRIIDTIVHSEGHWRDHDVLEIMTGIIQKHVQKSGVLPGAANRNLIAIEFWLRTLCFLPNWNTDTKVLHLLNNLLKCVFRNSDAHDIVIEYFLKRHEDTLKSLKEQGFLSSLLSFVISNPSHANLVDIKTSSSYAYYCYYILCVESLYQEKCGLKFALANKLHEKPDMCIETALKKVTSSMKDIVPIPSCNLDIYRWANLALSMDHDHPILATVWQKFFIQFLHRVPAGQGVPERGSVGLRFFESTANTTFLKKLKARLMGSVEHHKALCASRSVSEGDKASYKTPVELSTRLAKLFQTFTLWLDEPRIHDPTLFLQGLPPAYHAERLSKILNSDEMGDILSLFLKLAL